MDIKKNYDELGSVYNINEERKVYSANSQNNQMGSRREKEWENKMSNQAGKINQLYFQNTHTNLNQNNQSNNIESSNNNSKLILDPNNINQSLNIAVRNDLKSRGLIHGTGSPFDKEHDRSEAERKNVILNNFKQQINLSKNNKMLELEKKRREDDRYLSELENNYPFGRSGAGAPNRDKNGHIMAVRTRLISDPKYQHVNINVDDDFEEAHHQGKNIGLINFKKASPNSPVKINYNNANPHINYSNMNTNNNLDPINYNNKNNMNSLTYPQYNNQNIPNNNTNYQYNPMSNQTSHNYQQSYQEGLYPQPYNNYPTRLQNSNMPILYPPQEMNPNSNNNLNFVPNHSPKNIHPENVMDISVSYKNYELDEDKKKQEKNILAQALRNQMEQKENLKKMEKERKKEEDRKEEERLRKEREQMQFEFDKENEKKKRKIEEVKAENHKMIVDGVFVKAKPRDRQERKQQLEEVNKPEQIKFIVEQTEEKNDDQIKRNVENEISKLRNNLLDQQNEMLKQINELKAETQNANLQRYDALREISQLKEELANQRQDEDLRRKYVYDVLVDNSSKINHVYSSSKISNYDYFPIDEPKQKKKKNNNLDKMIFKEEIIKYPNRIPNLPDLDEAQDINLAAESKFIDVDTHFVMDGLHLYEPKANKKNIDFHSRQKAIQIEDDFIPLSNKNTMQEKFNDSKTSRFSDKPYNNISKGNFNRKVNEDIEKNKYILKEENLSVNQIYNKNMDRLKYLNNLENDNYNLKDLNKFGIDSHHNDKYPTRDGERNIENPDDNYDDFLNKISNLKLEDKTYTKGNYQEY